MSETPKSPETEAGTTSQLVDITIVDWNNSEESVWWAKDTPLGVLMRTFCLRMMVDEKRLQNVVFMFNGKSIRPSETPNDLGMAGKETIDAMFSAFHYDPKDPRSPLYDPDHPFNKQARAIEKLKNRGQKTKDSAGSSTSIVSDIKQEEDEPVDVECDGCGTELLPETDATIVCAYCNKKRACALCNHDLCPECDDSCALCESCEEIRNINDVDFWWCKKCSKDVCEKCRVCRTCSKRNPLYNIKKRHESISKGVERTMKEINEHEASKEEWGEINHKQ